jgi:transposase
LDLYCGIDWATAHHDVAVVDADGLVVARARVGNDAAGFAQLLTLLAEAGDSADEPIPVAIETDRGLVVAALRETGRGIYPINPLVASRYRSRYAVSGAKSDATDAVLLANNIHTDAAAHRPLPADTELAQAGRRRDLDRDVEWLRKVFTDIYLRQPPQVENAMGIQLSGLLRQFEAACAAADELAEAAIAHFEQHPDAAIISSFPGLGKLTGARVLAEIGDDRTRFADARGLKAFAGSAPITRASGKKTVVTHRHIKTGAWPTTGSIWALASLRSFPGARRHFDTRRAAGDWNRQAQRHLFNKFLGQLHHCLHTNQLYNEHLAFPPGLTFNFVRCPSMR